MDKELLFISYRCFMSKSEKMCYILSFLTPPVKSQDNNSCFTNQVDIFTDEAKYKAFVNAHKILESVKVQYEIMGDKVRYYI